MIDGGMNINLAALIALLPAGLLLALPPHMLIVIRQRDVEIKRLVPLIEPQANEGVLPTPVLDLQHKIPGRVEHRLHRALTLAGEHEAGGEELAGVGVLEPDLAAVAARHDAEAAGPDLVGLQPLAALVTSAGGSRRDLVHRHLAHHQERVLERLLVVDCRRR